ncbi:hypothetical protein [Streptomyces sp. NPDC001508]|uniref:hypothetical protein n=1 Tax=Streptomyces sp. NPDC001508 TaxID=3154656 RepID=UPI00331886BB
MSHGAREVRLAVGALGAGRSHGVELRGVTPADLGREFAALGRGRLEEEFARVAELRAV